MNDQILLDVGFQKHIENLANAEKTFLHETGPSVERYAVRDRLAFALLNLAGRLQPDVSYEIRRPAEASPVR